MLSPVAETVAPRSFADGALADFLAFVLCNYWEFPNSAEQ